jgi:ring-1,2-phenylacetyl-CoA epoxidase subunit PaaC
MTDSPVVARAPQGTPAISADPHFAYVLRHADDNLVLAHRLGEWVSNAPELEEDIALANTAIDHLGVARVLLTHAGALEGEGRDEDALAMTRTEREYTNVLLVEQPNGDFAMSMARAFFFDVYQLELWERLKTSADSTLAAIAAKAHKEVRYHYRHSSGWVIRLGDGTDESHQRMQAAVDALWRFTGELFVADDVDRAVIDHGIGVDPSDLRAPWLEAVVGVLNTAALEVPEEPIVRTGGRTGFHTEHLGHMLSEMQWMQRTYPGLEW